MWLMNSVKILLSALMNASATATFALAGVVHWRWTALVAVCAIVVLVFAGVDHLLSTYDREKQAFTKGEPGRGSHRADDLERIVAERGCATIAAVIIEPALGSTDVLPPPIGYLNRLRLNRLRSICDNYDILLIFDEFLGSFGGLGYGFAAERYGVIPDMITLAKE
jgi:beta-alanine--pyruvate transaminase